MVIAMQAKGKAQARSAAARQAGAGKGSRRRLYGGRQGRWRRQQRRQGKGGIPAINKPRSAVTPQQRQAVNGRHAVEGQPSRQIIPPPVRRYGPRPQWPQCSHTKVPPASSLSP